MKIENSVILITGGASGIGAEMAILFSSKGGIVYICDVQEELALELVKKLKNKIKFIKCDISNEEEVISMVDQIYKENGKIDIVINNAGITGIIETVGTDISILAENYKRVYEVNLLGSFLVTKYTAKYMILNADSSNECNGVIILISSIFGLDGGRGFVTYSGLKAALIGMVSPLARDLGTYKIRVNSIGPGSILTPMIESTRGTKGHSNQLEQTALKREGKPSEIAQCSEAIVVNDFLNGSHIRVDGGLRFPHM